MIQHPNSAIPIRLPRELAEGVCSECGEACYREGLRVICHGCWASIHVHSFSRKTPSPEAIAEQKAEIRANQLAAWQAGMSTSDRLLSEASGKLLRAQRKSVESR